jgi:hypothetical protein
VLLVDRVAADALPVTADTPLRVFSVTDAVIRRHAAVLRSIKSLETINGRPAAEFWKAFDAKTP